MLDKFDELTSWSRNAHRGGRIHRSLRHFPFRRVALDFVEGTEHAFSLRHGVGMTLRSGILYDMTVRRATLLSVEALYSSSRCFTLRRGILFFVAVLYSSSRHFTLRRGALLFVEAFYSSSRCFTLRRGTLLFVAVLYSSSRHFTLRRGALLFVEAFYSSSRHFTLRRGGVIDRTFVVTLFH